MDALPIQYIPVFRRAELGHQPPDLRAVVRALQAEQCPAVQKGQGQAAPEFRQHPPTYTLFYINTL